MILVLNNTVISDWLGQIVGKLGKLFISQPRYLL